MKNKGFLSTFYFGYFLCTVSIVGVIEQQLQLRIQTLLNIRDVEQTMDQQITILDYIQCQLLKGNLVEGSHQLDEIQIHVQTIDKGYKVQVESENSFEMYININEQEEIVNYYVKIV